MIFQPRDVDDYDYLSGGRRFSWFDPTEYARSFFGKEAKLHGDFFLYLFRRFGPPIHGWDEYKEAVGYLLETEHPKLYLRISFRGAHSSFGYLLSEELESELFEESTAARSAWLAKFQSWCWDQHQFLEFYPDPVSCPQLDTKKMKTVELWKSETGEAELNPQDIYKFDRWIEQKREQLAKLYEAINPRPPRQSPLVDGDLRSRVKAALIATIEDLARPVQVRDVWISPTGQVPVDDPIIAQEAERFKWAGYGITHDYYQKFEEES